MIGREVLDSRGDPTVEVEVYTDLGFGRAIVPSGASTGINEALELRDDESRYNGKGVVRAINNVNNIISRCIIGMDVQAQRDIDRSLIELDGTPNKSNLGANAILGVSIAVARAAANSIDVPLFQYLGGSNAYTLPVPIMNVINGGHHAGNELSIQEFHIIPIGTQTFSDALRIGVETYHELKDVLRASYGTGATNVGDEGGFAPCLTTTSEAFDAIITAVDNAGYSNEIRLGMDCAASEFFKDGKYTLDGKTFSSVELMDYYEQLVKSYPIVLIEDPLEQENFDDFARLTSRLSATVIVGDDLFVTNTNRLAKGIEMGAANSLLLKLNQIGTISEAFDASYPRI